MMGNSRVVKTLSYILSSTAQNSLAANEHSFYSSPNSVQAHGKEDGIKTNLWEIGYGGTG